MIRHTSARCLLLILLWPATGSAQTGSIRGSVVDQTDLVLPGATVTLRGNGVPRTAYSDEQGTFELAGVAPGTYTLHVSLAGFSDATVEDVTVSGAPLALPRVVLQLVSFGDTVVVTASRNEVRLIDAPVSTSVISTATLETTSAQNYGDLLRATPGVNVIQLSARDVQVTSRSPGNTLTNSQLVLVDGRSAYLDFFGLVLWDLLPTNFDDVEQIEVVRGPASAVWGANAMTGAVNIITKPPRESVGTTVTLSGGYVDRNDGSGTGRGAGSLFGANATVTRAPNDRLSYRVSAGYFTSAAFARPTGRIPVIDDPRQPGQTVGGAFYPLDSAVAAVGTGFANRGTSQPKFDVRVDQELSHGTLTYAGGVAGTDGLIHSGIGPFDMQSGTYLGYGKLTYTRGALRMQFFTNVLNGQAPNLLLPDLATGRPLQLDFTTQTYDGEIGHSVFLGNRHRLTYGGNVRQNNFDITLAPRGENRLEVGAYLQDEIFWERVRLVLGGRVDKFGNLSDPKVSPRIAFLVKPAENHSVTLSYNRAFRAPSVINNALQTNIVSPVDLSALAPLLPPGLQPAVAQPFPLVVAGVGSDIPIGGMSQDELTEESLTAYEVSYAGVLSRGTTLGGSFFVNRRDDAINFTALPPSLDPYTATHPPPGWRLPPGVLAQHGAVREISAPHRVHLPESGSGPPDRRGAVARAAGLTGSGRVHQLLVAVRTGDSGRSEPASAGGAQPAPDAPIQRRGDVERVAAPGFRLGERRHRRILERRPHRGVSRLHRWVRDRERQRRGEVAGWRRHDDGEGDQPVEPDRSAAHLRRPAPADRGGRGQVQALTRWTSRTRPSR